VRHRVLAAIVLCILITALLVFISVASSPVGEIEEHFELGRQWRTTGGFPAVLRPPGYPAFVALTLLARDGLQSLPLIGSRWPFTGALNDDKVVVLAAQGLLLVLTSGALFWFSSRDQRLLPALCVAALFGCNPYSIILVGTLSYYWLHVVLIVFSTIALALALERPDRARLLMAGLLWGVATLVRPVSLILPVFVVFLPLVHSGAGRTWRVFARFLGWFSLGMALAVLPVTVRNFAATGRVIPVNAQVGFGLWGNTIEKIPSHTGYLTWTVLWAEHGVPVMARVTGSAAPRPESVEDTIRLNDKFTRLALARIRQTPSIYAHNVFINFREFNLDRLGVWLKFFQRVQVGVPMGDVPDRPLDRPARWGAAAAEAMMIVMMVMALAGVAVGLWRRHPAAWTVAAVYASMVVAHSIMFLTPRYPYVKLPLVIVGAGIALNTLGLSTRMSAIVGAILLLAAIGSTLSLTS